jgi:hypothetical protein
VKPGTLALSDKRLFGETLASRAVDSAADRIARHMATSLAPNVARTHVAVGYDAELVQASTAFSLTTAEIEALVGMVAAARL